jgi:hypothetical protein
MIGNSLLVCYCYNPPPLTFGRTTTTLIPKHHVSQDWQLSIACIESQKFLDFEGNRNWYWNKIWSYGNGNMLKLQWVRLKLLNPSFNPNHSILIPFEIPSCMCMYHKKYDSGTTGKVLDAVEKWYFEPKRRNHVYPAQLAQRVVTRRGELIRSSHCMLLFVPCSVNSSLGYLKWKSWNQMQQEIGDQILDNIRATSLGSSIWV